MHITLQKREVGQLWSSAIAGHGQLDAHTSDDEQRRLMLERFQKEVSKALFLAGMWHLSWLSLLCSGRNLSCSAPDTQFGICRVRILVSRISCTRVQVNPAYCEKLEKSIWFGLIHSSDCIVDCFFFIARALYSFPCKWWWVLNRMDCGWCNSIQGLTSLKHNSLAVAQIPETSWEVSSNKRFHVVKSQGLEWYPKPEKMGARPSRKCRVLWLLSMVSTLDLIHPKVDIAVRWALWGVFCRHEWGIHLTYYWA